MKNKLFLFLSVIIVGLGLFVRIYKMENRAPFDWDQNRDYTVISDIAKGKFTLIGPVAKGEGGFFLGPLYYYLATPTYMLMHGDPRALPYTSISIDILTIIAILLVLPRVMGKKATLVVGSIWSLSWFTVEMSRISWNVVLIPLWSLGVIYFFTKSKALSFIEVGLLGLIFGLTWHIHASLIPISLILILLYFKKCFTNFSQLIAFGMGYLVPLLPLILFDIRHSGLNYHLMLEMFKNTGSLGYPWLKIITETLMRLGKNTQGIFIGNSAYNLPLGIALALVSLLISIQGKGIFKLASVMVLINIVAVLILKDPGFPEYYFALSYIPALIIFAYLASIFTFKNTYLYMTITALTLFLNLRHYTVIETTFSLSHKIALTKDLHDLNTPLALQFDMAPGREGGIIPLFKQLGGKIDQSSQTKVMISDHPSETIIIGGELGEVVGHYGGLTVAKHVVQ